MPGSTDLLTQLKDAKAELTRCMGGVDMAGCVRAAELITDLRLRLRDDAAMMAHLQRVLTTPESVSPSQEIRNRRRSRNK